VLNYPKHPLLNYQELLGLERIATTLQSSLKSPPESPRKVLSSVNFCKGFYRYRYPHQQPSTFKGRHLLMSTVTNHLENATVSDFANEINDDARPQANQENAPINTAHQHLGEAVEGLRSLFTELDKSYDRNKPIGQAMIMAKAVEAIEGRPTLKARLVEAITEGTAATLEVAVHHPATKPVLAAIKGFMKN
jgi:hypothetical protein